MSFLADSHFSVCTGSHRLSLIVLSTDVRQQGRVQGLWLSCARVLLSFWELQQRSRALASVAEGLTSSRVAQAPCPGKSMVFRSLPGTRQYILLCSKMTAFLVLSGGLDNYLTYLWGPGACEDSQPPNRSLVLRIHPQISDRAPADLLSDRAPADLLTRCVFPFTVNPSLLAIDICIFTLCK